MAGRVVVVEKDRRMIADELVAALGAEAWESKHLRNLRKQTLLRLAEKHVPGFVPSVSVTI